MGRPRKNVVNEPIPGVETFPVATVDPEPKEPTPAKEPEKREFQPFVPSGGDNRERSRTSFTLDSAGRPDVASLQESKKEQLKAWMRDPELRRALLGQEAAIAGIPDFVDADAEALYNLLGPIEGYVFALSMKVPVALAQKVFTYTDDEKAQLIPPTVALMNKYKEYLASYAQWKEEMNLGMCFFMITRAKIELLKKANAERVAAEPVNPALQRVEYQPHATMESQVHSNDFVTIPGSGSQAESRPIA